MDDRPALTREPQPQTWDHAELLLIAAATLPYIAQDVPAAWPRPGCTGRTDAIDPEVAEPLATLLDQLAERIEDGAGAIRPRHELSEIEGVLAAIHGSDDEDDQPIAIGLDGGTVPTDVERILAALHGLREDLEPAGGWPPEP